MTCCLVVDESQAIRRVARRMLECLELVVVEAADGARALEICRDQTPAVVLLVSRAQERGGLDFLRDLRALPDIDQPTLLFCPPEGEIHQVREALELGASEVLARPFDRAMLESKLSLTGAI